MRIRIKDFLIGFIVAFLLVSTPLTYYFGVIKPEEDRKQNAKVSKVETERNKFKRDLENSENRQYIKDEIARDLFDAGDRYSELYDLCEEKYQLGINGDLTGALEVKGKMTQIEEEIQKILDKYSNSSETDASLLNY